MRSRLRAGEPCPLHNNSRRCIPCHGQTVYRESVMRKQSGPVRKIEDEHHPRGYREICSPAELKRRKDKLLRDHPYCAVCDEKFFDYSDVDLAHRMPKGAGGFKRDDHMDNLVLMHRAENLEQGSRPLTEYLADKLADTAKQINLAAFSRAAQGTGC